MLNTLSVELALILGLFAVSMWLTLHFGIFSIAQVGLMAVGAYGAGIVSSRYNAPFVLSVLAGVAAATIVGVLLVAVLRKVTGVYLALATLAFTEVVIELLQLPSLQNVTGGTIGLSSISQDRSIPVTAIILGVIVVLTMGLYYSPYGRAASAIREDALRATSLGLDVARIQRHVLYAGAIVAGLGGALYAHYITYLTPPDFGFERLVEALALTVLGGVTYWIGPIVITLILEYVLSSLTSIQGTTVLIGYGIVLTVVMVVLPEGVFGPLPRIGSRLWSKRAAQRISTAEATLAGERVRPAPQVRMGQTRPDAITNLDGPSLLKASDVYLRIGGLEILKGAGVEVRKGELIGLIGPNGAGKTTLLNIITGFAACDKGSVLFEGAEVVGSSAQKLADLSMRRTFQSGYLVPTLTGLENVMLSGDAKYCRPLAAIRRRPGRFHKDDCERAYAALEEVSLTRAASLYPRQMSYGMRRRVEIRELPLFEPPTSPAR